MWTSVRVRLDSVSAIDILSIVVIELLLLRLIVVQLLLCSC